MATTTNYGWETPDDTDLVKDGASAIRTLGSSIDTTTKALNPETTLGDISYRSSTANTNTRLALGTAGQVLSVNSAATAPEWKTLNYGGLTLISETAASASTGLSFSSISGSYKQLMLCWSGISTSNTSTTFVLRFNNSSSSIYKGFFLKITGTTVANNSFVDTSAINSSFVSNNNSANLEQQASGIVLIDNYASTTKAKFYQVESHFFRASDGTDFSEFSTNTFDSTSAITSIDIVRSSGTGTFSNSGNTTIRLYGVA